MLKESLTDAFKYKGAPEKILFTFNLSPFYLQKDTRFSAFSFGPSARCFLEKLSLISLLKSDWKIHVFAFFPLSNIEKILIFQKKKREK